MKHTYENNNTKTLTCLLKRINKGEDPKLIRKEANQLILNVKPRDIIAAEQKLIHDGYPLQLVQQLLATFVMMSIPEQNNTLKTYLSPNHILRIVMIEHDLIKYFMAELNDVVEVIRYIDNLKDTSCEFRKLAHITEHLNAAKEHIAREEEVIFPYLKKYGWASLCLAVQRRDHVKIKNEIDNLTRLVVSFNEITVREFKECLNNINRHLAAIMLEHLFQEEDIFFPIAVGLVNNNKIWNEIKNICDEIGYCGVHL